MHRDAALAIPSAGRRPPLALVMLVAFSLDRCARPLAGESGITSEHPGVLAAEAAARRGQDAGALRAAG